ncbi:MULTISPECIES: hypothetical protein [Staphylococcus]|uniref:hypothetical protein n=1 Tax=Staphylococcus TaxID=1279 RepID=UPI0008A43598|nr:MULTISPECIES: hypothetical protein [Staphylococcus]MDS3912126.1 hypothetical protein [Staphylococcus hominis]NMD91529.1 hypothetical protein [Staphylococcus hominis]OFV25001.1 hypothetical protein HMPREF3131_01725 [Staphylococcus sp. HMSC14C01]
MLDSILSIISSILTILSIVIPLFHVQQKNSSKLAINNNIQLINNYKKVENIKYNSVNTTDNDIMFLILAFIGFVFSIILFVKFNYIILGLTSILVFIATLVNTIRIVRNNLSLKSYLYFAIKYFSISTILCLRVFDNPPVIVDLGHKLVKFDSSNLSEFINSIILMIKSTVKYIIELNIPSFDFFTLVFYIIAIITIWLSIITDFSKKNFFKTLENLYKTIKSFLIMWLFLILELIILYYLLNFEKLKDFTELFLNPIFKWLQFP